MRRTTSALAIGLVALALGCAGCGNAGRNAPVGLAAQLAAPAAPAKQQPQQSTAAATKTSATDGSNVTACNDGKCQVEVKANTDVPLGDGGGVDMLVINSVQGGQVAYATPDNRLSGSLTANCGAVLTQNSSQSACGAADDLPPPANGAHSTTLWIDSVNGDTAVVDFSTR